MDPQSRRLILIVDDDADIRDGLSDAFVDAGFEVQTAGNGVEALASLRHDPLPGMILLDLMMPLMDGYSFLEARRGEPRLEGVPVVLVTAAARLDHDRLGGVPVVSKPVDVEQLMSLVARSY